MDKNVVTRTLGAVITAIVFSMSGCSTEVSEGDLPEHSKPKDDAQEAANKKKLMEGMGGMYKGAPGRPAPKGN